MGNEIELISDGDGLAVIGNSEDVERFLVSEGLPSKELDVSRLGGVLKAGVRSRWEVPRSQPTRAAGCS